MAKIGILGAGTWGMALARMLVNSGHRVMVWSAIEKEIDQMSVERKQVNLPDMIIPDEVAFTKKIQEACSGADVVMFAVPSVFVRATARQAAPYIDNAIIVDVAKGMEADTLLTMSQVIRSEVGDKPIVALSGPTHAEEVARDIPSTIVSASDNSAAAEAVQDIFMNTCMRVYTNTDVLGVELCGALKNIIALAAGICVGLGYGDNTRAALLTRGIAEMGRLGAEMGCSLSTFAGLAGIGDLIVTATSMHSRNNRCGLLIGQGIPVEEAIRQIGMVVEGINALPAAIALAERYQVDMPIIRAVNDVIYHQADARQTVAKLMAREKKPEIR